jgi:cytochrome c oxidase subunit II
MKRIITVTAFVVFAAAVGTTAGWHGFATAAVPAGAEQIVRMTAKKFEYTPSELTLKKGVPVVLEITAVDRDHGFKIPELGIRADLKSGQVTRVRIVPDRTGTFEFRCDVFCGSGHEDMSGEIVVVD